MADEDILDRYNQVRREKYFEFIDPVSSANLRRLTQDPDVAMKEDSFFKMAEDFEDAEFCARLGLVSGCGFLLCQIILCPRR